MFIAGMFEYGKDDNCVGVDGIETCMGVFVSYGTQLFAIHVPDNTEESKKQGRDEFVNYFIRENAGYHEGATIYAVVRNGFREGAEAEVRGYHDRLSASETNFIRLNVNTKFGTAIVCRRDRTRGIKLKFIEFTHAGWNPGAGKARDGFYHNGSIGGKSYGVASTKTWATVVDPNNAQIKKMGASLTDDLSSLDRSSRSKKGCLIM
jgi:hypothetical protein